MTSVWKPATAAPTPTVSTHPPGSARRKVNRLRLRAITFMPYVAPLLNRLIHVEITDDEILDTMAVDGQGRLYYSQAFVLDGPLNPSTQEREPLEENELALVLVHEALHVFLDHIGRWERYKAVLQANNPLEKPSHYRWNLAADCEIDDDLIALPVPPSIAEYPGQRASLPAWAWYPSKLDPPQKDGNIAENYYPFTPKGGNGGGPGPGPGGRRKPWKPPPPGGKPPKGPLPPPPPFRGFLPGDHVTTRDGVKGIVAKATPKAPTEEEQQVEVVPLEEGGATCPPGGR